jgi:hypothetical protein
MMTQQVKDSQRMLGNNFEKLGKYVPCAMCHKSFISLHMTICENKLNWH